MVFGDNRLVFGDCNIVLDGFKLLFGVEKVVAIGFGRRHNAGEIV